MTGSGGVPPAEFWAVPEAELRTALAAGPEGLTSTEATRRLTSYGPNRFGERRHASSWALLVRQFESPIMLLLVAATMLSAFLGDRVDAAIILAILVASGLLGFIQERGAVNAVRDLLAAVRVHADVRRDGAEAEVPLDDVVPGDVVVLRAGDLIPADCRLLEADVLQVDESALTGEAYPVHKEPGETEATSAHDARRNSVFLGTHVISGSGAAMVVATGGRTELGRLGNQLETTEPPTSFERGLRAFGGLIVRVGMLLVVVVFAANVLLHRPVLDSLLFSLALAVGITPQLLPAIVTLTLARGATQMARLRVIVKRLSSIEDFGAMDELCVDKTGTLTLGSVGLGRTLDLLGNTDDEVAAQGWRNAHHQQGFHNPIDEAILAAVPPPAEPGTCLGEVPYDFQRKRLSVAVALPAGRMLVTKGAFDSVVAVCTTARVEGRTMPLADVLPGLTELYHRLSGDGMRVLALATRDLPPSEGSDPAHPLAEPVDAAAEHDLTMVGLLCFADPPKPSATQTIARLTAAGVRLRMITGDNAHVAAHVAAAVGLDTSTVLTGKDLDAIADADLGERVLACEVYAEVEPQHKARIVRALSEAGRTVGFLGDGINDALALKAADVGISVDTAVDVAKETASVVLLDKDLDVLLDGLRRGRQSFANTLKYIQVTISANFGNVVSMALATLVLPFLPMLPRQILLLNFLSDLPAMAIASDAVDPELVERPTHWDLRRIRDFMIVFGLVSSIADLTTFAVLRLGFHAGAEVFQTGWFVLSALTELLVMLVLRTHRFFLRSRPGNALLVLSALMAAVVVTLPFTPLGPGLGLAHLSAAVLVGLAAILTGYAVLTELAKRVFYRRRPAPAGPPPPAHTPDAPQSAA